jgi:hypothetical protein
MPLPGGRARTSQPRTDEVSPAWLDRLAAPSVTHEVGRRGRRYLRLVADASANDCTAVQVRTQSLGADTSGSIVRRLLWDRPPER